MLSAALQDAIFFSPHKLVGGPGAPGVLVVKRRLLSRAKVPTQPGGGTVFFVTSKYAMSWPSALATEIHGPACA